MTKTIPVSPKEAILQKWLMVVRDRKENTISFLVEQAILAYIKDGKFISVGKIHFDSKKDIFVKKTSINLYFEKHSEIEIWLNENKNYHIKSTKLIREILKHSIDIVPETEEESIPSYLEFDMMDSCNIPMLQKNEKIIHGIEKKEIEKKQEPTNVINPQNEKTKEQSFLENKPTKSKTRSFGLAGTRVKY